MAYAHEIAEETARMHMYDGAAFFAIGSPVEDYDAGHDVSRNVSGYATQRQSLMCTVYGNMVPDVVRELYARDQRMIESGDVAIIASRVGDSTTWNVATYRVFDDLTTARKVAANMLDDVLNLTTRLWV